jgi:cytochrome c biogenesis protein CcdA
LSVPDVLAYSAGLLTAFNPCGVVLLPSYLLYLLSGRVFPSQWRWANGIKAGLLTSLGVSAIFGVASIVLSLVGHVLFRIVPMFSLIMVLFLLILAIFTWRGSLGFGRIPGTQSLSRLQRFFEQGSALAFITYGLSYGMVSLTCSLPVFMVVIVAHLSTNGMASWLVYAAFTLGVATVITGLSAVTAVARSLVERVIAQIIPMVQKLSALIMVGAALYLVWYWLLGPGLPTVFS